MNLNRAKTILIYAFLGLNLFLCYHLFGEELRKLAPVAVSAAELRRVEEHLEREGYELDTKIECSAKKSAFLTVQSSRKMEQRLQRSFSAAAAPPTDSGEVSFYRGEGVEIRIYDGGFARVDLNPGRELPVHGVAADERDPVSAFDRFQQDGDFGLPEGRFDYSVSLGDKFYLHYVQLFEGKPIYSGYLKAFLENNTLVSLEIFALDPDTSHREREMEVIPATEALLRMAELLGPSRQNRKIIKADLGFYSREYDAEEWEVPPVWRFLFEDGESCYINAFTGNLEPETSN